MNIFSLPARRPAALLGATAVLTAGALVLTAPAAHATGGGSNGKATAATLRADLGVSLLNKAADVPLHVSLNEVHAPADANKTVLSAELKDVANGKAFSMLSADVATSKATANQKKATGYANLVNAQVHLPGLLLFPVIKVQQVTSTATCEAGKKPSAASNLLGDVVVLGKKVTLSAAGSAKVTVPAVGEVQLELSKTGTTTSTAAATALKLNVTVQPLNLNVAKVTGEVVLVEATCQTPVASASTGGSNSTGGSTSGGGSGSNSGSTSGGSAGSGSGGAAGSGGNSGSAGSGSGGSGSGGSASSGSSRTQTASSGNLAETGSSSATPLIAAGAGALIFAGGGALYMTRRRRAAASRG